MSHVYTYYIAGLGSDVAEVGEGTENVSSLETDSDLIAFSLVD